MSWARSFAALLGADYGWIAQQRQSDHVNVLLTDINRVGVGLNAALSLLATAVMMAVYLGAGFLLAPGLCGFGAQCAVASRGSDLAGQRQARSIELGRDYGLANRVLPGPLAGSARCKASKLAKILGAERPRRRRFHAGSPPRAMARSSCASLSSARAARAAGDAGRRGDVRRRVRRVGTHAAALAGAGAADPRAAAGAPDPDVLRHSAAGACVAKCRSGPAADRYLDPQQRRRP